MRAMPSAARDKLIFPAYAVAEALVLCGPDSSSQEARSEWVQFLQARQMTETLGWSPTDPSYGGWAETNQVYARPAPGRRMDVSRLADLSTTLFVVSGLRASQVAVDDPAIQKARGFVERCQNFEPPTGGTRDGGFFFCPGGRNRNKAGEFQSYGSTSADGIRALLLCGTPASDARVKAARRWLVSHFDANQNAGNFPKNKETVRQALYYYYCASLAVALQESGMVGDDVTWARSLCDTLLRKQKADGSWSNPVPVYCEDEPVLATLFALRSLMAARKTLADAPAR
jgi:squalene-hopene/tetraprenyl-beta-curcumene cyclase